ncbi:MAG: GNAT family N-acetyltransferase [Legionellales bacterium]|nr:GNAT family N-acetyltransferase [Legionellales bacterium]
MSQKNNFGQKMSVALSDWEVARWPNESILQGNWCSVAPIDFDKHVEKLFNALQKENSGESWTYLPYGPFNSQEEFAQWLAKTTLENGTKLYAICDMYSQPIGIAGYLRITPDQGVIEIGHLHFSADLKKTPAATEAMYLMMKYAFDLGYRRYEWKCNTLNEPSIQAAKRLGFTFEGVFRQHMVVKGYNRDTAWFSILDSEWADIKNKLEIWLRLANFNAEGKQINRLNTKE